MTENALLQTATKRIREATGPELRQIILFGSRARDDSTEESDYDLLIVVDGPPPNKRQHREALYRCLRGLGGMVEPWVVGADEFEETREIVGGIAYPAHQEGVVLYENA